MVGAYTRAPIIDDDSPCVCFLRARGDGCSRKTHYGTAREVLAAVDRAADRPRQVFAARMLSPARARALEILAAAAILMHKMLMGGAL
jgi:hypothetical protein